MPLGERRDVHNIPRQAVVDDDRRLPGLVGQLVGGQARQHCVLRGFLLCFRTASLDEDGPPVANGQCIVRGYLDLSLSGL